MDGLPLLYQHFLDLFRIGKIDVLLGLRRDHAGHTVLPVQIISVIEVGNRHDRHGR